MKRGSDARIPSLAFELRGDDAGVIEDEDVAAVEQPGQVEHGLVRNAVTLDQQQARGIARPGGP